MTLPIFCGSVPVVVMGSRLLLTQQYAYSRAWKQMDLHRLKPYFGWQQWNFCQTTFPQ